MRLTGLVAAARLYERDTVAEDARDWVSGPGAAFLRLKPSEVNTLRRIVAGAGSKDEVADQIKDHVTKRTKYKKGTSAWARKVAGDETLLTSLLKALADAANDACAERRSGSDWSAVRGEIPDKERAALDRDRHLRASLEFLDHLVRRHQARIFLKEGDNPCPPQQAS